MEHAVPRTHFVHGPLRDRDIYRPVEITCPTNAHVDTPGSREHPHVIPAPGQSVNSTASPLVVPKLNRTPIERDSDSAEFG
jgi:hypothetical protein